MDKIPNNAWLAPGGRFHMTIAWIALRPETNLIKAFRAVQWEIKEFAPLEFARTSLSGLKGVDVIVFELLDSLLLDIYQETCHKIIIPKFAMVTDLAYAQAALEAGADDFLVAPFHPIEALLRVRKLARTSQLIRTGDLEIDLATCRVNYSGCRLQLSPLEYRLLACLAKRVGQMVRYPMILQEVWRLEREYGSLGRLRNCIGRVRKKIELASRDPQYVITIPGTGYRLRNQRQWEARCRDVARKM